MTTNTPLIPEYVDDQRMACIVYLYGGRDPAELLEDALSHQRLFGRALSDEEALQARQLKAAGWSYLAIAEALYVSESTIGSLLRGETYRDVAESEGAA